jgi:hypothetical protein
MTFPAAANYWRRRRQNAAIAQMLEQHPNLRELIPERLRSVEE